MRIKYVSLARLACAGCCLFFATSVVFLALFLWASRQKPNLDRPSVLLVFDIDYTLFGLSSTVLNTLTPLYAEPFWDDAFIQANGFGLVWGFSRLMVPDPRSFLVGRQLGSDSVLSVYNTHFGLNAPLDVHFAINTDGRPVYDVWDEEVHASDAQREKLSELRGALDFNRRWHFLDSSSSCFDRFNSTSGQTTKGASLTPIQEKCAPFGHKDIMMQNIIDFYYETGVRRFSKILFVDDHGPNLEIIKRPTHLENGSVYRWGKHESLCERSNDCVFLAYPTRGLVPEILPTGINGSGIFPLTCAGCKYPVYGVPPREPSPYQGATTGLSPRDFRSDITDSYTLFGKTLSDVLAAEAR